MLSQINTLQKEQGEQRWYHDAGYVAAAVGKKARLGMKQRQTMKNQASFVELCLAEGISY